MKAHLLTGLAGPSLILLAACASTTPRELTDAHAAFDRASHGPAAQLDPADLHLAHEQLARADLSFNENGDSADTR